MWCYFCFVLIARRVRVVGCARLVLFYWLPLLCLMVRVCYIIDNYNIPLTHLLTHNRRGLINSLFITELLYLFLSLTILSFLSFSLWILSISSSFLFCLFFCFMFSFFLCYISLLSLLFQLLVLMPVKLFLYVFSKYFLFYLFTSIFLFPHFLLVNILVLGCDLQWWRFLHMQSRQHSRWNNSCCNLRNCR